jgi:hypothetical protein
MAFFPKQSGTTEQSFQIGAGHGKFTHTINAAGLTANRTWYVPNTNGASGDALITDGAGHLSWSPISSGGSPNLDGGTAAAIYGGGPLINGGGA